MPSSPDHSMHRFYFDPTAREDNRVWLDEAESKHALQVLRLKAGDSFVLLDGQGGVFEAHMEGTDGRRMVALLGARLPDNEASTRVTLYQGAPKAGKLETIVQKCTELGVYAVRPVLFSRCVREMTRNGDKHLARLERVAREAAKQCCRGVAPEISEAMPFAKALDAMGSHECILVPWEEAREERIADVMAEGQPRDIALVIGPEGGITKEEMERMGAVGGHAVTLGPRILRTETAGMAALAAIFSLTGDI